MLGREESASPETGVNRLTGVLARSLAEHDHVGREVFTLTPQSVAEPGPQAGFAQLHGAGIDEGDGGVVIDSLGVHRTHHADLVCDLLGPRQEIGNPGPRGSALPDGSDGLGHWKVLHAGGHAGDPLLTLDLGRKVFSVVLNQERRAVEEIDMRRAPGLEHVNDMLGLGGQPVGGMRDRITSCQHGGEGHRPEAVASGAEKGAAIEDGGKIVHGFSVWSPLRRD